MEGAFAADPQILNTDRTSGVVTRKSMFTKKPAVLGMKTAHLALPQLEIWWVWPVGYLTYLTKMGCSIA